MISQPTVTVLGRDPSRRRQFNINCYAFQQDAIVTFKGWQYACFYSFRQSDSSDGTGEPLYVHVARRQLPRGDWEVLVLDDYGQKTDDGHNTVQMGISPVDGVIHLSFDHHCDVLKYRSSVPEVATRPSDFEWTAELFTPTVNALPGLPASHPPFRDVTYPRFFGTLGGHLFCSFRDGKAGLGNDHLYLYEPAEKRFVYVGRHLTGIQSNPYVHGMDWRDGKLHVTWVYRGFVYYDGWNDPLDTKHKQQAGPNGAENNHDICYAYSDDMGYTWRNGTGTVIARLREGESITNDAEGIVAFKIPKHSGLTNQEAQTVDQDGGVHVLNRDTLDGTEHGAVWRHYYRSPEGIWSRRPIRPVAGSARGRLAVSKAGDLYILLPNFASSELQILRASREGGYATYEEVWRGSRLTGEPLVDPTRLEHDNVLSVLVLAEKEDDDDPARGRDVAVLDFQL